LLYNNVNSVVHYQLLKCFYRKYDGRAAGIALRLPLAPTGPNCGLRLQATEHVEMTSMEEVESVEEAEALGASLAQKLIGQGALAILEEINKDRESRRVQ